MDEIGVFEGIHTARAQRQFRLEPVPEALITRILDAALRAPSVGNAQNWAFVVVRDTERRPARHVRGPVAHSGHLGAVTFCPLSRDWRWQLND